MELLKAFSCEIVSKLHRKLRVELRSHASLYDSVLVRVLLKGCDFFFCPAYGCRVRWCHVFPAGTPSLTQQPVKEDSAVGDRAPSTPSVIVFTPHLYSATLVLSGNSKTPGTSLMIIGRSLMIIGRRFTLNANDEI